MIEGVGDWFRVLNGLGGIAVALLLGWRVIRVWRRYSFSQKMVFSALVFYSLGIAWRSWDLIVSNDLPFGIGLLLILIAQTLMIAYLCEPKNRYDKRLGVDLRNPCNRDHK